MKVLLARIAALSLCAALATAVTAAARDYVGTAGANDIDGTDRADRIRGLAGDDRIGGQGGDDALIGGPGNDVIGGGDGGDRMSGGSGDDAMGGDAGADRLSGGSGDDKLYGDFGPFPSGEFAPASLTGGPGNDEIEGGQGQNDVRAGDGDDVVRAANGARDTIDCGPGDDRAIIDPGGLDRAVGCERLDRRRSRYPRVTPAVGHPATAFTERYSPPPGEEFSDVQLYLTVTGPTRACSGVAEYDFFDRRTRLRPRDAGLTRWCRGTYTIEAVLLEYEGDEFVGPFATQYGAARFAVR